jgi:hypothetical protein
MNELATEIDDQELSELPKLTHKQSRFFELASTGKTLAESYAQAYDTTITDNHALRVQAAREKAKPALQAWFNYARIQQAKAIDYTLDNHFSELEECRQAGKELGNVAGMVAATRAKGEVAGHYKGKLDSAKSVSPVLIQVGQILGDDLADKLISQALADNHLQTLNTIEHK